MAIVNGDRDLRPVLTLDELVADPSKATGLPVEAVEALLVKHNAAGQALLGALLAARVNARVVEPAKDRLLSVEEAAARLAVTVDWLYRHAKTLPFTVRNGRRLGFSERGIERYIRQQQGS